jgi:hypothetical protein
MTDRQPWIVAAGALVARFHTETQSRDALTRLAAESGLGVAKASLREAMAAVAFMNKCFDAVPGAR